MRAVDARPCVRRVEHDEKEPPEAQASAALSVYRATTYRCKSVLLTLRVRLERPSALTRS